MLLGICDRHFVDFLTVRIHDHDEPATPIPSGHDGSMFEVARQYQGIFASGGIARQIDTFVIAENFFAVTEMEIIARHGEMFRYEKLQAWTPASNTAGITIVLAPAEGPENLPIVPQPTG